MKAGDVAGQLASQVGWARAGSVWLDVSHGCVTSFKAQVPCRGVCPGSGMCLTPAHMDCQGGLPRGSWELPPRGAVMGHVCQQPQRDVSRGSWRFASLTKLGGPPTLRQPHEAGAPEMRLSLSRATARNRPFSRAPGDP